MDIKEKVSRKLQPGKYVIAVSGGIDSVVLLDIVSRIKGLELIVAHFDHGIRTDSKLDQTFVGNLATKYQLIFETKSVKLGSNASEQLARDERYKFLKTVVDAQGAEGIITAHHQDDVIETAVFNLLRGTGRRGVTSLSSSELIIRPMLDITKDQIKQYALRHELLWREDSTNQDLKYSRNLIRSKLAGKNGSVVNKLLTRIDKLKATNQELDDALDQLLINVTKDGKLLRAKFISLSHGLALETMAKWLRLNGITEYDSKLLNNLVIASKTYKNRSRFSINKAAYLLIETEFLVIKTTTS